MWWGDERFLPEGDTERNVTQAREALLDSVPVDPARVHAMAASDGPYGSDVEAAAEAYASELAAAARPENHSSTPSFDVLLLGVGPDTHVASLFPSCPPCGDGADGGRSARRAKPPPLRISLTLPAIRAARRCGCWRPVRTRRRRSRWRCRAPGRSRPRPPARTGGSARCGCWTGPPPRAAEDLYPRRPPEHRSRRSARARDSRARADRCAAPSGGRRWSAAAGQRPRNSR
ncbi:6-phosphogluconolactonase [Streptomyces sp. M19]